jgi:dihydroorotase
MQLSKELPVKQKLLCAFTNLYIEVDVYFACYVVLGESGVVFAAKLYPAGATTNSQDGVT